jgi:hypothetical protein
MRPSRCASCLLLPAWLPLESHSQCTHTSRSTADSTNLRGSASHASHIAAAWFSLFGWQNAPQSLRFVQPNTPATLLTQSVHSCLLKRDGRTLQDSASQASHLSATGFALLCSQDAPQTLRLLPPAACMAADLDQHVSLRDVQAVVTNLLHNSDVTSSQVNKPMSKHIWWLIWISTLDSSMSMLLSPTCYITVM